MCVWTKKRGSMNAVVLMATPCPKSLHGKGEKWIARNILQGLDSRQPMTAITEKKRKKKLLSSNSRVTRERILERERERRGKLERGEE